MLFQGGALFDSLTVWQNIAFAVPGSDAARRARAIELLERVGLGADTADLGPAALSGGMQKRVALARAVAAGADMVFFDEPTAGLDPIMAGHISRLIRELVRDLGVTAVTISHDMPSVRVIADRVAMLYQGEIIWQGPANRLDKPDNPLVDQFVHGRSDGPFALQVRRA
jgi:phospholipid/cholesterol/gamma-HCH transport system ATP-binding protein